MTTKKIIITGITATTILTSVGISAIPQKNYYSDIPLPIELSQEHQTRISYNSVTIPTRANLLISESWLLGDKTLDFRPTEFQSEFVGAWANYMEDGEWKDIDPSFRETEDGFVMDNAPFEVVAPLTSTGVATFINDNTYNLKNKETFDEPILTQTIQAMGVVEVTGELETGDLEWGTATYVIYRQAYPDYDADLIYFVHEGTAPRLKKLIRFNSLEKAPSVDTEFDFKISYNEPVYIQRKIGDDFVGWTRKSDILNYKGVFNVKVTGSKFVNDDSKIRGNAMKAFEIWDSGVFGDKKIELINVNLSYLEDEVFVLTKIISSDFFADAQFPVYTDTTTDFYPDGDPESTSVDGHVKRDDVNEAWSTIRTSTGTLVDSSSSNFNFGAIACNPPVDKYSSLSRGFMLFDTSAIGSGYAVTSATLGVYGSVNVDTWSAFAPTYNLYSSNPTSTTALANGDYLTLGTTAFSDTSKAHSDFADDAYNTFTLNSSGIAAIDMEGISKFGGRNTNDASGTEPTWEESAEVKVVVLSADSASNKPKLSVTYEASAVRNRLIIIQ